ncbi:HtaA domain-containing protein [Microbacterium tumbae]
MNATATSSPVISRARVLIAALVSFLLIVAGAALAPPATAAGASVAGTVTSADESGISVQVSASGLGEVTAAYVALIVKGTESSVTGSSGYAAVAETPVAGGGASLTLNAPAGSLDREKDYEVIAWATRSTPNSSTIYGRGDVSVSAEQWDAVFGAEETDPGGTEPGETDPGEGDPGETDPTDPGETDPGETDPTDPGDTDPGETDPTDPGDTEPGDEEPAAPKLTVSKTQGLDPEGETLTVTAENYDTSAVSRHGSGKAGFYFQVGWIADDWRPSEGAPSAARAYAYAAWIADAANTFASATWTENGDGTADATWEIEVTEADLLAKKIDGATLAVFTVGAGGVVQAGSELAVPIAFAEPVPTGPSLTVSKTQDLDPEGETLTITAKNYDTSAVSRHGSGKAGFYFQVGWIADDWRPSEGAPSAARASAYSAWAADAANSFATVTWTENGDGTADATWVVEVTEDALLAEQKVDGGKLAVFTVGAGGVVQAGSELAVPIAFAGEEPPTTPNPPKEEEPGKTPQGTKTGGSLRWAISTSFTDYIIGSIAQGAIQVSGGATRSGGIFQFGQSSSSYDAETGLGTVSYRGIVRFTGHHGVLDVTMSNPRITITSAGSATLSLRNGGSEVPFATLDLSSARKSTANGAVTFTGAPATLTAAGRDRVLGGYSTVLDPVTFTIGSTAAAPNGSTGTVATASVQEKEELPDAPPATSGIEIDDANLEALQSGGRATITASGFQPNEQDIKVVVYSTPVLLDTVSADADGVATWTGTLPATLADGEHTLTLQGSVTRGLVFTLDRSASAALGQCTVEDASLNWGFKESFRTYIEGIANGGWELDGVVYEFPEYVWSAGAGSFDPETGNGLVTYGGTIEFTGHDGALDTTLANARLEFAGDTGYLVFDVTGTTQGGEAIDQQGVRFAEFALGDVVVADGVISLDALPATLTEAGAAAFGTYAAGEALDPVSAVVPVDAECGTAPVAEPEAETAVTDTQVEEVPEETGGDAPVWPWIAGGAVLLVLAFAAGLLVARRGRNGAADAEKETADA